MPLIGRVLVAMQMQVGRRALALLLTVCTLLAGVLALRHEATVAHVRESLTGALAHAHALAEEHAHDTTPHLHGRDVHAHAEAGTCVLLAALDHSTILARSLAGTDVPQLVDALGPPLAVAPSVARSLYRLAPKTSPPAHA